MNTLHKMVLTGVGGLCAALLPRVALACSPYGYIGDNWDALGGASGPLGACVDDEANDGAGGRIEEFAHGYSNWVYPEEAAYACWGPAGEAWLSRYGGPSVTGQTYEDLTTGQWGSGQVCTFVVRSGEYEGAQMFLVYNPGSDGEECYVNSDHVCDIYGAIGQYWLHVAGGADIGLPIDEAYSASYGARQDFQNMYITWNSSNGNSCAYWNDGILYEGSDC